MARVGLIHAAVSRRTSPHTPMDNMTTRYNPIRLLKGAPPGQELVNHYASELAIHKNKRLRRNICEAHHLVEIDAYNKYDYHHNVFDKPVDRETKFYNPDCVADAVRSLV
jgi:hypothetical protein